MRKTILVRHYVFGIGGWPGAPLSLSSVYAGSAEEWKDELPSGRTRLLSSLDLSRLSVDRAFGRSRRNVVLMHQCMRDQAQEAEA